MTVAAQIQKNTQLAKFANGGLLEYFNLTLTGSYAITQKVRGKRIEAAWAIAQGSTVQALKVTWSGQTITVTGTANEAVQLFAITY